jgi:shikimate dehydrogenase
LDHYGLIGKSLKHSFSEAYFADKFSKKKINAVYENFELENIELFPVLIKSVHALKGLNVTIPYKKQVMEYLDELDASALAAQAVNTIVVLKKGQEIILKGFNTDCWAFTITLQTMLLPHHKKALILGTGGAAGAVSAALNNLNIESLMVSREPKSGTILYIDINKEIIEQHHIIINCTPVGMFPEINGFPLIPYQFITKNHIAYDLIYNPAETIFLKKSAAAGAVIKNGLDMLKLQAEMAWQIWNT